MLKVFILFQVKSFSFISNQNQINLQRVIYYKFMVNKNNNPEQSFYILHVCFNLILIHFFVYSGFYVLSLSTMSLIKNVKKLVFYGEYLAYLFVFFFEWIVRKLSVKLRKVSCLLILIWVERHIKITCSLFI